MASIQKESIHKEDITILNVYGPNNMKQKLKWKEK